MDFKLDPALEQLKETMRSLVKDKAIPLEQIMLQIPPELRRSGFGGGPTDSTGEGLDERYADLGKQLRTGIQELRQISKDTGIFDMYVPEEYGGGGMGALGHVVAAEEADKSLIGVPTANVPNVLFGNCTPEQEQKYLWPAIRGEKSSAFGQTEPQSGSDPGNMMQTRAVKDGDDWVLNGTKMFVSGAATADYIMLQAVTDEEKRQRGGITMFLIDKGTPGVSFAPIRVWVSPFQAGQYFIFLDNVRIPQSQVLGEVGNGFRLGQRWLAHHDRLLRGPLALGIMSRGLDMAVDWVKQTVTFGVPLSERQAIQWYLVDTYVAIKTLRAITYETAWRADQGEDVRVEASLVKYYAAEIGWQCIDKLQQCFGGLGETYDLPFVNWYMTLRHARIGGGTSEIHKFNMARAILGGAVDWHS